MAKSAFCRGRSLRRPQLGKFSASSQTTLSTWYWSGHGNTSSSRLRSKRLSFSTPQLLKEAILGITILNEKLSAVTRIRNVKDLCLGQRRILDSLQFFEAPWSYLEVIQHAISSSIRPRCLHRWCDWASRWEKSGNFLLFGEISSSVESRNGALP